MKHEGSIQNMDYRDAFGVDRRAALAALNDLVAQGVLKRVGERRRSRYQPGPAWRWWVNSAQREGE